MAQDIMDLPPELLKIIFHLSTDTGLTTPRTISHVCRKWSAVARSTAAIWKRVVVRQPRVQSDLQEQLNVLKDFLSLTETCMGLQVSLVMHPHPLSGPTRHNELSKKHVQFWTRVFDILLPSAHRWSSLCCIIEQTAFFVFLKAIEEFFGMEPDSEDTESPFVSLKSLSLHGSTTAYPLNLLCPPGLESLDVIGRCVLSPNASPVTFPNLRSLHFGITSPNTFDFLNALTLAPNLTHLKMTTLGQPSTDEDGTLTIVDLGIYILMPPKTLPSLHALTLDIRGSEGPLSPYLDLIPTPKLVHLTICYDGGWWIPWESLTLFLGQCFAAAEDDSEPKELERLSLFITCPEECPTERDDAYNAFIQAVDCIRVLDINACAEEIGPGIINQLSISPDQSDHALNFPKLETLNVMVSVPPITDAQPAWRTDAVSEALVSLGNVITAIQSWKHPSLVRVNVHVEADHMYLHAFRARKHRPLMLENAFQESERERVDLGVFGGQVGERLMDKLVELEGLTNLGDERCEPSGLKVEVVWDIRCSSSSTHPADIWRD